MFASYLKLLVNPKNEIALACVIDVPSRGINHKTFTNIRKIAHEKNLSMYQVFILADFLSSVTH